MRLGEILSKPISKNFEQVENFIGNKSLTIGNTRKIEVGTLSRLYFCKRCNLPMTFLPINNKTVVCHRVGENILSITTVLKCTSPNCNTYIPIWYLLEAENSNDIVPFTKVRLLNTIEKLNENVKLSENRYGEFTNLLEKAEIAFRNELGAAAITYLRKVFEGITHKIAMANNFPTNDKKGKTKPFYQILESVDEQYQIVPEEFSKNRYELYRELSNIMHGGKIEDEILGLKKYSSLRRLVVGILDNVKNKNELQDALENLNWKQEGEKGEQN